VHHAAAVAVLQRLQHLAHHLLDGPLVAEAVAADLVEQLAPVYVLEHQVHVRLVLADLQQAADRVVIQGLQDPGLPHCDLASPRAVLLRDALDRHGRAACRRAHGVREARGR